MKKFGIILVVILVIFGIGFWYVNSHRGAMTKIAVNQAENLLKFTQLDDETKAKFGVIIDIANAMLEQDDITRRYLILLQNNMELRPGGGFLGQYAVVEVKNGEIISHYLEDANNLDVKYKSDRIASAELQKYTGIKKWKFRDSNFSPNFLTNVEDALHFYELAGENSNFDGVFAVNAAVLEDVLEITGPIIIPGDKQSQLGEFNSENVLIKLEDAIEEKFARADERKACEKALKKAGITKEMNEQAWWDCSHDENGKKLRKVSHADRVDRKKVLGKMSDEILKHLVKTENIEPVIKLVVKNLIDKDVQLWFKDENLQNLVEENNWAGRIDENWDGDYLMIVDANLGALKTDYYIQRKMEYIVDFTGRNAEVNDASAGRMVRYLTPEIKEEVFAGTFKTKAPLATAKMSYENTATEPSYRNSDYHSYTRLFVPEGSKWYVREWFEPPLLEKDIFTGKQNYAYKFDVLIGDTIPTMLQYTLPKNITEDNYKLKIQKQSGIGTIPLKVTIITSDGKKHSQEVDFDTDKIFTLKEIDGKLNLVVE
jgi:hypothetical protein